MSGNLLLAPLLRHSLGSQDRLQCASGRRGGPFGLQRSGRGPDHSARAHDDFEVTGVHISVSDANGQSFESGDAVETPANSGRWVYATTTAVPAGTHVRIAVTASDQPGGMGEATAEKSL